MSTLWHVKWDADTFSEFKTKTWSHRKRSALSSAQQDVCRHPSSPPRPRPPHHLGLTMLHLRFQCLLTGCNQVTSRLWIINSYKYNLWQQKGKLVDAMCSRLSEIFTFKRSNSRDDFIVFGSAHVTVWQNLGQGDLVVSPEGRRSAQ